MLLVTTILEKIKKVTGKLNKQTFLINSLVNTSWSHKFSHLHGLSGLIRSNLILPAGLTGVCSSLAFVSFLSSIPLIISLPFDSSSCVFRRNLLAKLEHLIFLFLMPLHCLSISRRPNFLSCRLSSKCNERDF